MSNACYVCSSPSRVTPSAYDTENQGRTPPQRSVPASLTVMSFGRLHPGSVGMYQRVHIAVSHGENAPFPDRE
jgi:hypothetical protein